MKKKKTKPQNPSKGGILQQNEKQVYRSESPLSLVETIRTISQMVKKGHCNLYWSKFPFKENRLWDLYPILEGPEVGPVGEDGLLIHSETACYPTYPQYGIAVPPDEKIILQLEAIIGKPLTLGRLRAFLEGECNLKNLQDLTLDDILHICLENSEKKIHLSENEKKVLRELAKYPDIKLSLIVIEESTGISRKTVSRIVKKLSMLGLAVKYNRGVSITRKGQDIVK